MESESTAPALTAYGTLCLLEARLTGSGDAARKPAIVNDFGADPTGKADSSAAIQRAMDSGATTVFLPGNYALRSTVVIRGKVRRVVGTGGMIDYTSQVKPDFRLVDGEAPVVMLEHFAHIHGGLEVDTRRTLVLRSVSDCDLTSTRRAEGAEWFFEDVVTHKLALNRQKLWARQLNIENEGTHLLNDAGDAWILGYKTERGGTLLDTRGGGFSYTTTAGQLAPMFVNTDSAVWTYFSEVCYNGDPFQALHAVEESLREAGAAPALRWITSRVRPAARRFSTPLRGWFRFSAQRTHGSRRGQRFWRRSAAWFAAPPGRGWWGMRRAWIRDRCGDGGRCWGSCHGDPPPGNPSLAAVGEGGVA